MALDAFLEKLGSEELRIVRLQLNPSRWKKYCDEYKHNWNFTPFEPNRVNQIPEKPGLYCFYIGHDLKCLPRIGLSLYGGITTRTLKIRFKEYLNEKDNDKGRITVKKFLNVFDGELSFGWVVVENTSILSQLEKDFNDAMMPPYSIKDYSAIVRSERNAWQ
ncbi:MAG: hypothetical protein OXC57_13105 [Rhodobacteraceae bacterium]|nr:hypothetical protein [Paracoccaceae bacterium]